MRSTVRDIRAELGPMFRLGLPVVIGELGWMAMGVVDTVMVGDLGAEALLLLREGEVHSLSSLRAFGSGFQRGSRFSAKARGPSAKSGWLQCRRSRPQAASSASL